MSQRSQNLSLALTVVVALLMAGPQAQAAKKIKVKGEIQTAEDLNPDYQGRPSPVNLIIFALKAAEGFQNADFFSLYDPESGVLGGDLIERNQMLLKPGEVRPYEAEFDKEVSYLGIVAAYRDIQNAEWRGLVELPEKKLKDKILFFKKKKLTIQVDALAVSIVIE